ncbi:hypothetical protein V1524DRAFT_445409 [Lipomyces starkeyi]
MMTTELGPTLCRRLWLVSKTIRESSWQLDKLKITKEEILEQIDSQKSYATSRSKQALPPLLQQVRDSADSIEKLMLERTSPNNFQKIRRRRPGIEKEIQRYNSLVDALPIAPELKPDKLDYELLQREMRDEEDVSSFPSDVPCWVNNSEMRKAIQLHLQVQALLLRAVNALIAYANSQRRCDILLVEKIWSGIKVAHGLSSNLYSMCRATWVLMPFVEY